MRHVEPLHTIIFCQSKFILHHYAQVGPPSLYTGSKDKYLCARPGFTYEQGKKTKIMVSNEHNAIA